jgi:4-hydroxy-tetrahydrodipicolinate synthase
MSTTRGELFAGVTVAIVTPFKNGEIDWPALAELIDWHVSQGTDALAPCGTTGESPTLTHDENERVVAFVCEKAAGRIKIMAGTGSNSTAEAVRMTKAAKKAGANGTLQVGPYYNIPGRTASNILPETIAKLAEAYTSVVAVKEATGSLDQASQIAALTDLSILSGDDSLTLPLMSIGGVGVVSVVGNIVPQDMTALVRAFKAGKHAEALTWHRKLFPLCRDMLSVATNPIPVKTALKLLGRGTGELRLPMCAMDAAGEAKVRATLVSYGLLAG